jgi:hypothetical protein
MMRLAIVLLAGAVAFGIPVVGRAETATGSAYVTTLPSGADIWVDGTYIGRSPVLVDALLPGHHAVTITKTGWVVQEVDVTVGAGTVALSTTRLLAGPKALAGTATGTATIRSAPAGATIAVDGAVIDKAIGRSLSLAAGPHHVALTTPRGKMTIAFVVLPDTATDLVLAEPRSKEAPSAVVAPADDYLPDGSAVVEGKKIVVRYGGHIAVARFGETGVRFDGSVLQFDGAPESIGGRLYLPLALLEKLTTEAAKSS